MSGNPNLGKVLQREDDPQEPVFEPVAAKDAEIGGIAVDRLRSLIERIERLEEEKKSDCRRHPRHFRRSQICRFRRKGHARNSQAPQNGCRRPRRKGTSPGNLLQSLGFVKTMQNYRCGRHAFAK